MSNNAQRHTRDSSFSVKRYTGNGSLKNVPVIVPELVRRKTEKLVSKYSKLAKTVKEVGSTFGVRKHEIMQAIEEGNIEHAVGQFQRQAYSTVVNLIPIAEKAYLKDRREHQIYCLNALISQGRELAADLMAANNREQLAQTLLHEVLEPAFKNILQQVMQEQMHMKAVLSDKIKPPYVTMTSSEQDESLRRIAAAMTEIFKSTADQFNRKILGE